MPFYKEKIHYLTPDEDKVFSTENRSIVYKNANDKAILFIHGFPTTPHMYKDVTKYSFNEGYDIYAPLIPTFGSSIKEFTKTNFSSWFNYIDSYYIKLRNEYKELYVVGVSMGGAMTLKLCEVHNEELKPNAVAVLSAPLVFNSLFKDHIVTNFGAYFLRIIKIFCKSINGKCVTYIEGQNDGAEYWHGYSGLFPKQALSLIWNLKTIRKDLKKINVPLISFHDLTDRTVLYKNHEILKAELDTKVSKFITTEMSSESINTHHSLLMYESTRIVLMKQILEFFKSKEMM